MARELILFKSGQGAAGARGVAGPSGAAGTAAPNVTSATGAAVYSMASAASVFGFAGVITLPTGHADYAHLAEIQVEAQAPGSTSWQPVARVMRASFGGATVAYAGGEWAMPTAAAATWSVRVVAVNEYGSPTAAPVTISVTVDASKVTSVTGAEGGALTLENTNVYTGINYSPVLEGDHVPQNVATMFSDNNGGRWVYIGYQPQTAVGQTLSLRRPKPLLGTNWKVACAAGPIGGDPSVWLSVLPAGFVPSGSIAVGGYVAPAAGAVTGISAGTITARGSWAELDGVNWTDPTADIYTWLVKFYVRETDAAGNPAPDQKGTWREWFERQAVGGARTSIGTGGPGPLMITYRAASDTHHYLEIQCVAVNRVSTNPTDWAGANTASSVAQGAVMRLDFGTVGNYNPPVVQAPSTTGVTITAAFVQGPASSTGAKQFGWSGSVTRPTDLTNYNGMHLSQQWEGANETDVGDLNATALVFSNGYWTQPTIATYVDLRAYPVSRDGQRGAPAVYRLNIPAAASSGSGWYVDAAGTLHISDAGTLSRGLQNGSFEDGLYAWEVGSGVYLDATPYGGWPQSGSKSLTFGTSGGAASYAITDLKYACKPGETYAIRIVLNCQSGCSSIMTLRIGWSDVAGTETWDPTRNIGPSEATNWTEFYNTLTVPAGKSYLRVLFQPWDYAHSDTVIRTGGWVLDYIRIVQQVSTGYGQTSDGNGGTQNANPNTGTSDLLNWDFSLTPASTYIPAVSTGWNGGPGAGGNQPFVTNSNDGVGNFAVLDGAGAYIQQTVKCTKGQKLVCQARLRCGSNSGFRMAIFLYDAAFNLLGGGPWTSFGGAYTSGAWLDSATGTTGAITDVLAAYAIIRFEIYTPFGAAGSMHVTKVRLNPAVY